MAERRKDQWAVEPTVAQKDTKNTSARLESPKEATSYKDKLLPDGERSRGNDQGRAGGMRWAKRQKEAGKQEFRMGELQACWNSE
ncbi:uncharacterized protein SPSK_10432 [Sporothrix schenckii 1099-18]|uniref:Uncharacterized protein n=1 Tax=Sporothrix schenckii 1099-18 TaxID=1397361 RepID=A0A0F2MBH3_SPOSC|nr:uncharacterized protein SPSK_10432 [Sporothrix schenckii 1099-18]KJR86977.1 hypothetical protein SPSK_10432 [Sporothrix schenckii 1099-18]